MQLIVKHMRKLKRRVSYRHLLAYNKFYTLLLRFVSLLLSLGQAKQTLGFIVHDAHNVLIMNMFITTCTIKQLTFSCNLG